MAQRRQALYHALVVGSIMEVARVHRKANHKRLKPKPEHEALHPEPAPPDFGKISGFRVSNLGKFGVSVCHVDALR